MWQSKFHNQLTIKRLLCWITNFYAQIFHLNFSPENIKVGECICCPFNKRTETVLNVEEAGIVSPPNRKKYPAKRAQRLTPIDKVLQKLSAKTKTRLRAVRCQVQKYIYFLFVLKIETKTLWPKTELMKNPWFFSVDVQIKLILFLSRDADYSNSINTCIMDSRSICKKYILEIYNPCKHGFASSRNTILQFPLLHFFEFQKVAAHKKKLFPIYHSFFHTQKTLFSWWRSINLPMCIYKRFVNK